MFLFCFMTDPMVHSPKEEKHEFLKRAEHCNDCRQRQSVVEVQGSYSYIYMLGTC